LLAIISHEQNKLKKAIENYNLALRHSSNNPTIHYNLGVIYSKLNQYELSIQHTKKVIDLSPNDMDAYLNLSVLYRITNNYKLAIEYLKKAIKKQVDNVALYNDLGILLLNTDKIDESFFYFKQGLNIDSNHWHLNGSVLQVYLYLNDLQKSHSQFNMVINLPVPKNNEFSTFLEEDNLNPLLKTTNLEIAKSYFQFLIKNLEEKQLLQELWKAFPKAIFNMLINIEDYPQDRLTQLNTYLQETFKPYKEMVIPLLYLDIGIRYLKKGDERAIYDFSKEERQIFQEFVLDKRAVKIME